MSLAIDVFLAERFGIVPVQPPRHLGISQVKQPSLLQSTISLVVLWELSQPLLSPTGLGWDNAHLELPFHLLTFGTRYC